MSSAVIPFTPQAKQSQIERDYLSWSAIATYLTCPLKYEFRYLKQIPEETVSSSMVFGRAIHAALEFHYQQILEGDPKPNLDGLLRAYREAWNPEPDDKPVRFKPGENEVGLEKLARKMLLAYSVSELARPEGTVIAVEEELRGPLVPECPDILGRIDLMVDTGGSLLLRDFKTSRCRWSSLQAEASAGQLVLYGALASELMLPSRKVQLEFVVLAKTATPSVESHSVLFDNLQVRRIERVVQRVWQSIQAGHFFPAPSPANCATCPFERPCRAWPIG